MSEKSKEELRKEFMIEYTIEMKYVNNLAELRKMRDEYNIFLQKVFSALKLDSPQFLLMSYEDKLCTAFAEIYRLKEGEKK